MNDMQKKYNNLEEQMVRYKDLISAFVKDNGESFIKLDPKIIPNGYMPAMDDMEKITSNQPIVRESVFKKLQQAQSKLKLSHSNYTLFVTYGYRSLEVQTKKFLEQLNVVARNYFPNPIDLYEEVHRYIAVPTVAGHPTGGAIDIIIKDESTSTSLDFGSTQYDYSTKDCYVFTSHISEEAKANRMLLRHVLTEVGFAPFDGEWWHFSYGDREWAHYYSKDFAVYDQKSTVEVKKMLLE